MRLFLLLPERSCKLTDHRTKTSCCETHPVISVAVFFFGRFSAGSDGPGKAGG